MAMKLVAKKRQTSHKIWITDLLNSTYVKSSGWDPAYVEFGGNKISRAHLVATVVGKFTSEDGNYAAITMDDGTETIRSKAFGPDVAKLRKVKTGAVVRFIGKVKEYNEERYLSPEAVRVLDDPNWTIVHKLELGPPVAEVPASSEVKPEVPETVAEEALKNEDISIQKGILEIIRTSDTGQGAEMDDITAKAGLPADEVKNIIIGLLKSGEVYEPRKGRIKVLD
ncbi:MAG: OB-fold nucleic acid binding domain-containing protein [archaeon]